MQTSLARRSLVVLATTALGAGSLPVLLAGPASATTDTLIEVVAEGLDNPRGIAFGPDGVLYVAESGTGGDGPCSAAGDPEEPGNPDSVPMVCYGATGAITAVDTMDDHAQTRIATGLPSVALTEGEGNEATGPSDVSVAPDGSLQVIIGLGAVEEERAELGEQGQLLGRLVTIDPETGEAEYGADLAAWDYANDPVPGMNPETGEDAPPDSNPYAVLAQEGRTLVADAGGNSLLSVTDDEISLVATFPTREADAPPFLGLPPGTKIPMEAVPTSIVESADGDVLVGELTGFPFPVGAANVYEIDESADPDDAAVVSTAGLTTIADVADRDGHRFVLEFAHESLLAEEPKGALVRVRPDGTRQLLLEDELLFPGGMAVHPTDGSIYLTNNGILAGAGQVLRIDPSLAGDPAIQTACPPDEMAGPTYDDIAESVHEEAIACLTWWEVIRGATADAFVPGGNLTRGQTASLLARLVDATDADLPAAQRNHFTDDGGSVHEEAINRLASAGIIKGSSATTYSPEGDVTRAQLASLAVRAHEFITGRTIATAPDAFDDDEGSVHEANIDKAAVRGWVEGTGDRRYSPRASITRAQASSLLARLLSSLVQAEHADPPAAG